MGLKKSWRKDVAPQRGRRWSKEEIKRLKKLFPVMPTRRVLSHFSGRSKAAVIGMAQTLGLRKNYLGRTPFRGQLPANQKLWSPADIASLRALWRQGYTESQIAEIIDKKPDSVRYQIYRQVRDAGLPKKLKSWSKEDQDFLVNHYHDMSAGQIAATMRTTKASIHHKACRLEITRPNHWTPEDIETLRQLWRQGKTSEEIAESIGKTKSAVDHQLERQRRHFGLQGKTKRWSEEAKEYIRRHYHTNTGVDQIAAALAVTTVMVHAVAHRLKLIRPNSHDPWSQEETDRLRELYPVTSKGQLLAHFSGRSHSAIKGKAQLLGLRKRKP